MYKLAGLVLVVATVLWTTLLAQPVFAAPSPNPNTVAYYESGIHAIPTNPLMWLVGTDIVEKEGDGHVFNQWFYNSEIGYHSVWREMTGSDNCSGVVFHDPYPEWGNYLKPGADYCVMTNEFAGQH